MNSEHDEAREAFITERLQALRRATADLEAPPNVQQAVMAAFRSRGSFRRRVRRFAWFASASAAACAAAMTLVIVQVPPVPAPPQPIVAEMRPPAFPMAMPAHRLGRRQPRPVAKPAAAPRAEPHVLATDFLPLPFAPPMLPNDDGQIVRVRLPRSAMRTVGLPVSEDRLGERVPADVLLGEDGFARAVRFVRVAR
jgi:hypothetical protein